MRFGWFLPLCIALSTLLAACQGCRQATDPTAGVEAPAGPPSLRLYFMSTVAGALEPCGCSQDQLGGLDHVAAFMHADEASAQAHLLLAAGPLFFIDPKLDKDHASQDRSKAEAIAGAMKTLGLAAWAPGFNDWAAGTDELQKLAEAAGAAPLAAGLAQASPPKSFAAHKLITSGSLRVGVVGLSDPKGALGRYPEGVSGLADARAVLAQEIAALQSEGAQLVIAVAAMPRGEALRLADTAGLHMLLVGQPSAEGHGNTEQPPAELIGQTLVVETANHGQTVAVVDVHVRGDATTLTLADAGGVAKAARVADVSRRIRELEARINSWEKGGTVNAQDIAARKRDLDKLRQERTELEREDAPPKGSFFRYRVQEIREGLGEDESVAKRMLAHYKEVNEHNKKAFADRLPLEPAAGAAAYVGVEECTLCHAEARAVWDKTAHAKAYATLVKGFKEYNLECVNCHVTGYGKPGGSTVTHNDKLRDVQCEDCHGPGSLHIDNPEDTTLIQRKPDPSSCVARCHHPPHVEGFDAVAKMDLVLGPGHGKK